MIGDTEEILANYGGLLNNDLNEKLNSMDDIDSEQNNSYPKSTYIDTDELMTYLKGNKDKVTMLSLNCKSINAKFNNIELMINYLRDQDQHFDLICLQECWMDENCDTSMYELENYNMVSQERKCCGHGGLITYIDKRYSF